MFIQQNMTFDCRYAVHPDCEPPGLATQDEAILVLQTFQIRARDTLDFGIDMTGWLGANNSPDIIGVSWSVTPDSPATPTINSQSFDKASKVSVVITPAATAKGGDAYHLEAKIDLDAVQASAGVPAIAARSIYRRIRVVVVNG